MNRAESGKVIRWMVRILQGEVLAIKPPTKLSIGAYKRRENYGV